VVGRTEVALGVSALVILAGLLFTLPPGAPRASPSPAQSAASPLPNPTRPASSLPSSSPQASPAPPALALPPPGLEGRTQAGTLFVQLELSANSVRVLYVEARPGLPFRLRGATGRYGLQLEGRDGARASLRFDAEALASTDQDEVSGDELRLAAAPVLLKLPRVQLPARLRVISPRGTLLGEVELRE